MHRVKVRRVDLECTRYAMHYQFPFGAYKITTEQARDAARHLAVRLEAQLLSKKMRTVEVSYPATWWDHFKHEVVSKWPAWMQRPFVAPKFTTRTVEAREFYPDISIPEKAHFVTVQVVELPKIR